MDPASQPHSDGNGRDEPHEDESHDEPEPAHERPSEPMRRRLARWRREHPRGALIALVVLVAALAIAVLVWWQLHTHESTDDAQVDGHIAPVSTRLSGTVAGVFVEDNQPVQVGQLLVQLDPRDYEVALARAQAELAQARAQLAALSPTVPITATTNVTQIATTAGDVDTARAAIAAAERDYQSALAHVRAAQAADARAQADLARYKFLLGQRAIPQERYDQIVATAKSTRADVDAARAQAHAAQKSVEEQRLRRQQAESRHGEANRNAQGQISIREANIEAQRAAVQAAEAAVERAKLDLSYTKIVAPVAGVVGRRSVEPGQRVQPGEALVAVVELDTLWVTANFKETQLRRLRVGQPARISVDALGVKLDGSVESLAGASGARYSLLPPENATGNYVKVVQRLPVRIKLLPNQDPHRQLRIGMSVEPTVALR
jgi:membrane fusion protein (multidrug efflux system)